MSGETKQHISGWTVDVLHEHLIGSIDAADKRYEQRFIAQEKAVKDALAAQEKAVNAALASSEKAVAVAESNAEKWRTNANEWRGSMNDREQKFVQTPEFVALKERVGKIEDRARDHQSESRGAKDLWGWIVAIVMFVFAIISFFHKGV